MINPSAAISPSVAGSDHTPYSLQWTLAAVGATSPGPPLDLTGATITARIAQDGAGDRAATGVITVGDALNGFFSYQPTAADVVAGRFHIQFTATYPDGSVEISDALQLVFDPAI